MLKSEASDSDDLSLVKAHTPLYYCSKIIGLITFDVIPPKLNDTKKLSRFSLNLGWLLYSVIMLTIYVVCYAFCIIEKEEREDVAKKFSAITSVGHILHMSLGMFTSIIIFSYSITNFKSFERILRQLQTIDDELNGINSTEKLNYQIFLKFQTKMIIAGFILFLSIGIFNGVIFTDLFNAAIWFVLVSYIFPYLSSSVVQFQFVVAVYNIYHRFQVINKYLNYIANVNKPTSKTLNFSNLTQELSESSNKNTPFTITNHLLDYENDNRDRPPSYSNFQQKFKGNESQWNRDSRNNMNISHGLQNTDRNNINNDDTITSNKSTTNVQNAKSLEKLKRNEENRKNYKYLHLKMNELFILHDKLCDISEIINDAFAVQLVACITTSFVITLFGFFFETKVIFWAWGSNYKLILVATSYVVWGILMSIIIFINLKYCTAAREEAYESALVIHKILQHKPAFMLNDEIYYSKMKSFTLQVLHRKNTFHFNGLGLFRLDYTFIFSVVSAATSYLIVLLQFDLSDDVMDNSTTTANATSFAKNINITKVSN